MESPRHASPLIAGLALALILAQPGMARAQCTITGPSALCGGTITLCGPPDAIAQEWLMPDGSMQVAPCITVGDPGTYRLHVLDMTTFTWGPWCERVVTGTPGAPVISGPQGACTGETVQLCGPDGPFEYGWTGPDGSTGSARCVNAAAGGSWELRVRELPDGCWSAAASQLLSFSGCGRVENCPRPVWWWALQLPGHDASGQRLDPAVVERIAACVDLSDPYFAWSPLMKGFRRTLQPEQRTLRAKAERQVAGVRANVCASEQQVTTPRGQAIGLGAGTSIALPGVSGTVAEWLTRADAELARLATLEAKRPAVKEGYRTLIRVGWSLNHGLGIGPTCRNAGEDLDDEPAATTSLAGSAPASSARAGGADREPLSIELMEETDAPLVFGALQPNPFTSSTRLAYAVSSGTPEEVSIRVVDVSGRLVRQLVSGSHVDGQYEARWDGRASDGSPAKSGLYFILGRIGGQQIQTRVTYVR